jgi:hypothetical protein
MLLVHDTKIFSNSLSKGCYRRRLIQNKSDTIMIDYFFTCFKINYMTKKPVNSMILKSETYHHKARQNILDPIIINERRVTYYEDFSNLFKKEGA